MPSSPVRAIFTVGVVACMACSPTPDVDAGVDSGIVIADAGARDASVFDASTGDAGREDAAGWIDERGFNIRTPLARDVPCEGMFCSGSTTTGYDTDYVCTLRHDGRNEFVYVQATPLRFAGFTGYVHEVRGAWRSAGGVVDEITAIYEWGGNHHNDTLTVDLAPFRYRYNHSSFGFGFRQCQPMDCLEVYRLDDGGVVQNGCDPARTLPEICKLVQGDAGVPPLVDTFATCPGDDG